MDVFRLIAERRILEAMQQGILDNLTGSGRPLLFDDETWIPVELRPVYRCLKNAGLLPPELEERRAIICLRDLIGTLDDHTERLARFRELDFRITRLNVQRQRRISLNDEARITERLMGAGVKGSGS